MALFSKTKKPEKAVAETKTKKSDAKDRSSM